MVTATADHRAPHAGHRLAALFALGLSAVSAAAHLTMIHDIGVARQAVVVAMAAACVACGVHLVRMSSRSAAPPAWALTAAMSSVMIGAHLTGNHVHGTHAHAVGLVDVSMSSSDPAMSASLGLAFAECVFALTMLWITTCDRNAQIFTSSTPQLIQFQGDSKCPLQTRS
ncbi:hypothetical protein ACW2Q0_18745 [Nocardia sp. R16R-3T]